MNTDPVGPGAVGGGARPSGTGLGALANWHMVTGSARPRSTRSGRTTGCPSRSTKTGLEAHNDVMVFISPDGRVVYRATPFADESDDAGRTARPRRRCRAWGEGIATYAERLLGQ